MVESVDLPKEICAKSDASANELKELRLELGFNQEQMAKALGLSGKNYISMLESGRYKFTPSVCKCIEYIRVLVGLGYKIKL